MDMLNFKDIECCLREMLSNVNEDFLAVWANGSMAKSAVWIIMLSPLLLHVLGQLPTPQNVKLTSVNFKYFVTWKAGAGSVPGTRYIVTACDLRSNGTFIPVKKCINITTMSCDLSQTFKIFHDLYWVRVISITNTSKSNWVESNELLPLRDTILGPPIVNVTSNIQTIKITLDMPLTPHKDNDKPMTVKGIDLSLIYIVTLLDKDGKELALDKVEPDESGKGVYQFKNLKTKSTYCVTATFLSTTNKNTKDSRKICTTTSPQNADILWIAPLIAVLVFIASTIICSFVIWMLKEFAHLHLTQSKLPKSLIIISEDLHVDLHCKELDENPEGDHISFITYDDRSNSYLLERQSADLDSKLEHTSHDCAKDTAESIFYECNDLRREANGHNSPMRETNACKYRDFGGILPYMQSSIENRGSTSSIQQNSPGTTVLHDFQYEQVPSLKNTQGRRSSNVDKYIPALESLQCSLDTYQEGHVETTNGEFWKLADVPLSSVKLSFNDYSEKGTTKIDLCGDEPFNSLGTEDMCSQLTCDLTVAADQSLNSNREYQPQSIKLLQVMNDCALQNMGQQSAFHISQSERIPFTEYEAH
ncbi:interleukin-20 receptor subunit alpha-like isoform X2 [Scyliorhinus torazame]|uniref:interleukin-20 receptor subunit alpha-like isoform X2 n=1 Tax=Scyliorhinus torazame TaxID=75743 RepID=UPI003B5B2176